MHDAVAHRHHGLDPIRDEAGIAGTLTACPWPARRGTMSDALADRRQASEQARRFD
jgi:hypothetical protein